MRRRMSAMVITINRSTYTKTRFFTTSAYIQSSHVINMPAHIQYWPLHITAPATLPCKIQFLYVSVRSWTHRFICIHRKMKHLRHGQQLIFYLVKQKMLDFNTCKEVMVVKEQFTGVHALNSDLSPSINGIYCPCAV